MSVSELQALVIQNQITIGSTALYCYDLLVSLDQEIEHIWSHKWTLSTWIFIINRYATLMDMIIDIVTPTTYLSCIASIRLDNILGLLIILVSALFTGLRAYALCGQNIWIFVLVFALGMVGFAINLETYVTLTLSFFETPSGGICGISMTASEKTTLGLTIATRVTAIIADIIVLAVTWRKTVGIVRRASRLEIRAPLSEVLIRDGTIFFLALLLINIYSVLSFDVLSNHFLVEAFEPLLSPLNSIVISRFMLNLRQVGKTPEGLPSDTTIPRSTLIFNSNVLVGNMGESLAFGEEDDHSHNHSDTRTSLEDSPQRSDDVEQISDATLPVSPEPPSSSMERHEAVVEERRGRMP